MTLRVRVTVTVMNNGTDNNGKNPTVRKSAGFPTHCPMEILRPYAAAVTLQLLSPVRNVDVPHICV